MADTAALRKARGAFFTPPELSNFVADWALRSPRDSILEPSCGEAAFLLAAGERLRTRGAQQIAPTQLWGIEIHSESVQNARALLAAQDLPARIEERDFFDISLPSKFDVVLGNPPYVRYQNFVGEARIKAQQAALAQGVRLQNLANSWAAFVVHASTFLKPEGRMGLVLPAELLTVNYAAPVRRFLLQRFAKIRLILFESRVFPGVLEEVVLLLAEGTGPTDHYDLYQASDLRDLHGGKARSSFPSNPAAKWTTSLIPQDSSEAYAHLMEGPAFWKLLDWGEIDLGMVTGNNHYFTLTVQAVKLLGLDQDELARISPPSSRHLRGLTFTNQTWSDMAAQEGRVFLFYPPVEGPSQAALRYISMGESVGVHQAYKCRVRSPWWRVPTVRVPDLFFTYMNHDTPRLVTNCAGVLHLNSIHGVTLKEDLRQIGMELLPMAMLNSLTLLGAELVGRSYGGGILKLEPKEADQLPVPSLEMVREIESPLRDLRPQLARHLQQGQLSEAVQLVDRLLFTRTLKLGHDRLQSLRLARDLMFSRRIARAGKKR
jgi:adenine-specific DNA methylase